MMGPGVVPSSLCAMREALGAKLRDVMERNMEGAVLSCESPDTFGGCEGLFAPEFVESLFDGTPMTCLGWLRVDSDAGGVVEVSLLSDNGAKSPGRSTFPRVLPASGRRTKPESDSPLTVDTLSTELSGGVCG